MKYLNELKEALLEEDFYETEEVIVKIKEEQNSFEYLAHILEFMEENQELDYGMPGPIVHYMESYYQKGYEGLLLKSVQNVPTAHTVWMLNRIINDPNLHNKEEYIDTLRSALRRDDISDDARQVIEGFVRYQDNK